MPLINSRKQVKIEEHSSSVSPFPFTLLLSSCNHYSCVSVIIIQQPHYRNGVIVVVAVVAAMSNPPPPSAFDVLMSGARAASAKNKQSSSSSPNNTRKRKISPHSTKPSQNPSETETVQQPNEPREETAEVELPNKITIIRTATSLIDELKERVPRLKRKPSEFDPGTVACWEKGKSVPFLFLSLAFHMISEESSRIVITDILCNLLRTVMHATPEDLVPVVYLSACRIAPPHEGLELGIQEATIIKVAAEACGRTESHIKNELKVISLVLLVC